MILALIGAEIIWGGHYIPPPLPGRVILRPLPGRGLIQFLRRLVMRGEWRRVSAVWWGTGYRQNIDVRVFFIFLFFIPNPKIKRTSRKWNGFSPEILKLWPDKGGGDKAYLYPILYSIVHGSVPHIHWQYFYVWLKNYHSNPRGGVTMIAFAIPMPSWWL